MAVDSQQALNLALELANAAGALIATMRQEGSFTQSFKKVETDLVTSADLASEKLIIEGIKRHFPNHAILSEEFNATVAAEKLRGPLWIIDPIDGTTNYAHGHAHCAVSIAFAEEGQVRAAVVHTPFVPETFSARKGAGAFLNSKPIKARQLNDLRSALICIGFAGREYLQETQMGQVSRVLTNCRELRRLGAASLDICWVACGRLDGFFESLAPWDIAAACLIAREAGATVGRVNDLEGVQTLPDELNGQDLLVAPGEIFEDLKRLLS